MLLDRSSYSFWLRGKKKSEVVGFLDYSQDCPLTSYLKEHKGMLSAILRNGNTIAVPKGPEEHIDEENPKWVRKYMLLMDKHLQGGEITMTAQQALTLLKSCK